MTRALIFSLPLGFGKDGIHGTVMYDRSETMELG
jgi:hypothetical protein